MTGVSRRRWTRSSDRSREVSTEADDAGAMASTARGDRDGLETLYARYGGLAYALALRTVTDPGVAQEIVQEAFVALWRHADRYRDDRCSPRSWIMTIVRNRAIDELRRRRREPAACELDDRQPEAVEDDPWPEVWKLHCRDAIRDALERLPAEQRHVVELGFFAGMSHAEIASRLDTPLGTIKKRMRTGLQRLRLSLGATLLLDEGLRRRPVGLVTAESGSDTPLVGSLYYLDKALEPFTELRHGDLHTLLQREIAVIVLADRPVAPSEVAELQRWVEGGGLLLRFAGPRSADTMDEFGQPVADPFMPERLLAEDRQLGGALSWSQPARLAPFPAASPFAGLAVPEEVTVNRQVLAEPSAQLAAHTWARLADGTPLVTEAARGSGRVVLFHVTANADWSNLPLSGLFPDMMRRLVALSAGVSATPDAAPLSPAETLDGFGVLGAPPPAASGLAGTAFATTVVSPLHPPGLYGPEAGRRALNLSNAMAPLAAAAPVPGAAQSVLNGGVRERAIGPFLVAAGLAILAVDLLIGLRLRGLLRPAFAALLLLAGPVRAQLPSPPWRAALDTRLAFLMSGDAAVDGTARAGLVGLSGYVNLRTAAHLGEPAGVQPGTDDLSFYPLLYWPVAQGQVLSAPAVTALNVFMRDGGIIVIDSRGDPAALRTAAAGLAIPPLTPLTTEHVLSRAFYLLSEYPGRVSGDTVWVQRQGDRSNDDVSPVVIGSHDWASAWAVDGGGRNTIAVEGGPRQRTLAYRFGVNLVMYALTGNYKGDQVHVPHILERLGQ